MDEARQSAQVTVGKKNQSCFHVIRVENFRFHCRLQSTVGTANLRGEEKRFCLTNSRFPHSISQNSNRTRKFLSVPLCAVLFANSEGHHHLAVSTTPLSPRLLPLSSVASSIHNNTNIGSNIPIYSSINNIITQNMASSRVHHFKLVLLGDTAVGKSCLVVRFVRDEFFEFQEPTIGG